MKKDKESENVVVAEDAIYVQNHDINKMKPIVSTLQVQDWIGGIYTEAINQGCNNGIVEGTVSFDAIHWNHSERATDILVDYNWNDKKIRWVMLEQVLVVP